MISKGISADSLITRFPELFEQRPSASYSKQNSKDDMIIESDVNSMFDKEAFQDIKAIGKHQESQKDFEKIFGVYKINRERPDNLFKIFSKLKNELEESQEEKSETASFKTIEVCQSQVLNGIDLASVQTVFPKGFRSRKLRRTLLALEKRFQEQ